MGRSLKFLQSLQSLSEKKTGDLSIQVCNALRSYLNMWIYPSPQRGILRNWLPMRCCSAAIASPRKSNPLLHSYLSSIRFLCSQWMGYRVLRGCLFGESFLLMLATNLLQAGHTVLLLLLCCWGDQGRSIEHFRGGRGEARIGVRVLSHQVVAAMEIRSEWKQWVRRDVWEGSPLSNLTWTCLPDGACWRSWRRCQRELLERRVLGTKSHRIRISIDWGTEEERH